MNCRICSLSCFTTVVQREAVLNRVFFKVNRVFVDIFWLVCRMSLIFFRAQRYDVRQPSEYIEHGHATRRKFSRSLWKTFHSKNMHFWSICQPSSESVDFSKIQSFLRFLPYNSYDVSYDSNSFSSVKIWS